MGRILFIPWSQTDAPEFSQYGVQWNSAHTHSRASTLARHQWDIVHYGDSPALIKSLSAGSTIRIIGHGGSGEHELAGDQNGNHRIKYDEVCDRLISTGLNRKFVGVIDLHSCCSAVPSTGRQSFAAKVSQYLRGKGYLLISFVGYFGELDAEYHDGGGGYK
jgi:hypothetical protein